MRRDRDPRHDGRRQAARSPAAPPMAAPRDVQFDAARMAAAQRSMSTMAKMDSMGVADSRATTDPNEQKVGGRTFRLDAGVWTDARPAGTTRVVTIKAYSKAYFDLLKQLPELSSIVGLGRADYRRRARSGDFDTDLGDGDSERSGIGSSCQGVVRGLEHGEHGD